MCLVSSSHGRSCRTTASYYLHLSLNIAPNRYSSIHFIGSLGRLLYEYTSSSCLYYILGLSKSLKSIFRVTCPQNFNFLILTTSVLLVPGFFEKLSRIHCNIWRLILHSTSAVIALFLTTFSCFIILCLDSEGIFRYSNAHLDNIFVFFSVRYSDFTWSILTSPIRRAHLGIFLILLNMYSIFFNLMVRPFFTMSFTTWASGSMDNGSKVEIREPIKNFSRVHYIH